MRRLGYELSVQTAMKTDAPPDQIGPADLKPLSCANCGYELTGLTIHGSHVTCPECSMLQPIMNWPPDLIPKPTKLDLVLRGFAWVGILFTLFLILILMIAIV